MAWFDECDHGLGQPSLAQRASARFERVSAFGMGRAARVRRMHTDLPDLVVHAGASISGKYLPRKTGDGATEPCWLLGTDPTTPFGR